MSLKLSAVAVSCVILCAPLAQAQNLDPIMAARLSAQLYYVGLEQADPLMIITAAKLRKQIVVERIERNPERDGEPPTSAMPPDPLTWEVMLHAAQTQSVDDPLMTELIEDVRAETSRGVRTGRVESYTSIRAGGTNTYRPLEFTPGVYADVYVEGSGTSDLNLFVRDAEGRLVCSDTDISAIAYCGWQPDSVQAYAVLVQNKGQQPSTYKLMTN